MSLKERCRDLKFKVELPNLIQSSSKGHASTRYASPQLFVLYMLPCLEII